MPQVGTVACAMHLVVSGLLLAHGLSAAACLLLLVCNPAVDHSFP